MSSSISIINGDKQSKISYSYYLKGEEEGKFIIGESSVLIDGEKWETKPIEITILPNPDGIIEDESEMENEDFFFRDMPEFSSPRHKIERKPEKKKRKTYKL